ncbi:MAG: SAM-dependent methyltransferase [Myxococcota bacterium]
MHLLLTAAGFEDALLDEIDRAQAGPARVLAPTVISLEPRVRPELTDFCFARHVLFDASPIRGASVQALADAAVFPWVPILDAAEEPWELQAFIPDEAEEAAGLSRRVELVAERIEEALKKRRKRVLKRQEVGARKLAQVLLLGREEGYSALADRISLPGGATWPSAHPGGRAPVEDDWDAPSSAFRKLREALAWHPSKMRSGQRVVDLGAAPGGWTHVALGTGAEVLAIDKAEMDPRLASHPLLRHVKKDAFNFEPEDPPVDWLLSDVIAEPEKTLALLLGWAEKNWMKHFIVHLKFKGADRYALVEEALKKLRKAGYKNVRAKKLYFDKNEVTLLG